METQNPFAPLADEGFMRMLEGRPQQEIPRTQQTEAWVREWRIKEREQEQLEATNMIVAAIAIAALVFLLRRHLASAADATMINGLAAGVKGKRRVSGFFTRTRERVLEKADE